MTYSEAHWQRVRAQVAEMVAEVPLYQSYAERSPAVPDASATAAATEGWLWSLPVVGKRELRRGFPKSLLRSAQDLNAEMHAERVTLLATSGTTADRLQVIWEWTWWDPQERDAMRLNPRIKAAMAKTDYREAVLTTPACGGGTCHIGDQSVAERTIDGMLFFNQRPDPSQWGDSELARMLQEWSDFAPRGLEADPAYLALLCREARRRNLRLPSPDFVSLTYETTTRAMRRDIALALDAPLFQLYGATEAGVLFMECEHGRLHPNERWGHVDLVPIDGALARVVVTTLDRPWMPLLRYDIGDVVRRAVNDECACGLRSDGPLLERVEGRASDCLTVNGKTVTPLMLDDAIFAAAPDIQQWQLLAALPEQSESPVLCVAGGDAATAKHAAAAASDLLGKPVSAERVIGIAAEVSGKYRLVR